MSVKRIETRKMGSDLAAMDRPGEGPGVQIPTVDRILSAAARLFAARGMAGVGLREITAEAGVNLAAVNYYFGSKEKLLEALFLRRAQPITAERMRLLACCAEGPGRPPMLEQLLEAFLRPAFSLGLEAGVDGATFGRLRARLSVESEELYRRIVAQAFNPSTRAFLDAIDAALPELPRAEVEWRFHFMLGTMIYTMAGSGRIQSITEGQCRPGEVDMALAKLVPFLCAGFRAPVTG
ncbi:TetR family transcriptional regulator [Siccirubricoccus deserti]|uniref:TetR/AcrR family transcriptional regulator n=1 Tax=Siccirubricoccus deserti TaxID=2013562 RepID=A0A9X0UEK7_9PROT|nr:TetR/AcrR family transcriptional regulator [Siccirubricoccus deserti]MBC4017979.1 TetR/AcrR family transcriptional regulator [Siccirubricoccus deserti]GGC28451.1 TetR family transcriptional regulator [Siccirubricoccus deserti]